MTRFTGTVSLLTCVDVSSLVAWIKAISLERWPQQSRHVLKPAMVTDPAWFGFGAMAAPLVESLMRQFLLVPGCRPYNLMLSAVMPGDGIEPHVDQQSDAWLCRVHCPLVNEGGSYFNVGGVAHVMAVGLAYRVNVLAEHSVLNEGDSPRIHLMFDVEAA